MKKIRIILFDGFETLDAFGPAQIFSGIKDEFELDYISFEGGLIKSRQNIQVQTRLPDERDKDSVFLIPGGMGTRRLVNDEAWLLKLKDCLQMASEILTVCTGSGLLAKTGMLDGVKATSNKKAFDWAVSQNAHVIWVKKARWIHDKNIYTSSGVSAGMDMALGYIQDNLGTEKAELIAQNIEYLWNSDSQEDPFCL